jgi:hypothetical protein
MVLDDSSYESAAGLVDRGIPFARSVRHSPGGGLLCFIVLIELVDTQEGGSEWLGKRRFPAGGFVRGPVLWSSRYAAGGWWVWERSSLSAQSPLGAKILPVEQTIRRWRVGTGQHAS